MFTHFALELRVLAAAVTDLPPELIAATAKTPLPTLMRKAVTAGLLALDAKERDKPD